MNTSVNNVYPLQTLSLRMFHHLVVLPAKSEPGRLVSASQGLTSITYGNLLSKAIRRHRDECQALQDRHQGELESLQRAGLRRYRWWGVPCVLAGLVVGVLGQSATHRYLTLQASAASAESILVMFSRAKNQKLDGVNPGYYVVGAEHKVDPMVAATPATELDAYPEHIATAAILQPAASAITPLMESKPANPAVAVKVIAPKGVAALEPHVTAPTAPTP